MSFLFGLEKFVAERRGDGSGDEKGREERNRDREGQRDQQQPRDADDEENGEEDDHGGDRRGEDRHGDFAGGFHDRLPAVPFVVEMALNVLEFDDRIVDEPADPERQSAEREDVQCLAGEVKHDEGHQD